jgi:cytochrome b561
MGRAVVLVLTVGRLLWRWRHPPPPLPATVVRWQAALAPIAHWALLLLLLAQPLSGWLMSSAAGVCVLWFAIFPCPTWCRPASACSKPCGPRIMSARLLIAVLVCTSPPSSTTMCVRRDGVFRRMWPFGGT